MGIQGQVCLSISGLARGAIDHHDKQLRGKWRDMKVSEAAYYAHEGRGGTFEHASVRAPPLAAEKTYSFELHSAGALGGFGGLMLVIIAIRTENMVARDISEEAEFRFIWHDNAGAISSA
jgi:hypothetical protein